LQSSLIKLCERKFDFSRPYIFTQSFCRKWGVCGRPASRVRAHLGRWIEPNSIWSGARDSSAFFFVSRRVSGVHNKILECHSGHSTQKRKVVAPEVRACGGRRASGGLARTTAQSSLSPRISPRPNDGNEQQSCASHPRRRGWSKNSCARHAVWWPSHIQLD
jgi:hypothetical protein